MEKGEEIKYKLLVKMIYDKHSSSIPTYPSPSSTPETKPKPKPKPNQIIPKIKTWKNSNKRMSNSMGC
ncbi:hypothetical protein MTR_6g072492 [Medicago truncatula]|uniref:Uncharacterized protein n=1 Tax=Medicago truncatula TaxID=3880 RepID=A0A072UBD3_MEDTR|nr:hypothetical protein MTR_6g072492 [Medicago truncatula]